MKTRGHAKRAALASKVAELRRGGMIGHERSALPPADVLEGALLRCAERARRQLLDSIVFIPCRRSLPNEHTAYSRSDGGCPVVPPAPRKPKKVA